MCTVTYLPLKNGYLLTSNRDEAPKRNAIAVEKSTIKNTAIVYPKDPLSNGTWIAVNEQGNTACLLNGAYEIFLPKPSYRHSRGRIILDYFEHTSFEQFSQVYPLYDLAPFTLVIMENGDLHTLVWDGEQKYVSHLDAAQHFMWSSATLYDRLIQTWRRQLFEEWVKDQTTFQQEHIIDFHKFGTESDKENGFVMNRNEIVKTLSISSIRVNDQQSSFSYIDLNSEKVEQHNFQHQKKAVHAE